MFWIPGDYKIKIKVITNYYLFVLGLLSLYHHVVYSQANWKYSTERWYPLFKNNIKIKNKN